MDSWAHDLNVDDLDIFGDSVVSGGVTSAASAKGTSATGAAASASGAASASVKETLVASAPVEQELAASASVKEALVASAPAENDLSALAPAKKKLAASACKRQPLSAMAKRGSKRKRAASATASAKRAASAQAPAPRQLKRNASLGQPSGLTCQSRLCLWGDNFKAPAVIHPVHRRDGQWFFPIHERLYWLRRACGDKRTTHWTQTFQQAVSSLRRHLQAGIRLKVDAFAAATEQARTALALDGEDEEPTPRKQQRIRVPVGVEVVGVEVGAVTVKVRVRERPFEVETTAEAVMAIVGFCTAAIETSSAARTSAAPASANGEKKSFAFAAQDCPAVLGCVTWHPSVGAWAVHFKNEHGATQVKRVFGKRISATYIERAASAESKESWAATRRHTYLEAIEAWNTLDRSTRSRIPLPAWASDTPSPSGK